MPAIAASENVVALPAGKPGKAAKLPETRPKGVDGDSAWAMALKYFKRNRQLEAAKTEEKRFTDRLIEGGAGTVAAVAISFVVPLALEAFPRAKKIGPEGGFQLDTEGLLALAAVSLGLGAYVLDIEGGDVAYAAGIGLACAYVSSKAREWGQQWWGDDGVSFSIAA